jgi:hypothetical protein
VGDLTYLIILFVVINLVGRLLRALQKGSVQQKPGARPEQQSSPKSKSPFAALEERLQELAKFEEKAASVEKSPPHPYFETSPEAFAPELKSVETPRDFAREVAAVHEAGFEKKPRKELHEKAFPWQGTRYEYRPPGKPVTPAPRPEPDYARSYRSDIVGMLQDVENVRSAVLLSTILGPCRAREGRHRFRGPR